MVDSGSPARAAATVDLSAISANVRRLQQCAPESQVMAVVKADGYGHGLVQSARAARNGGAQWLGVALLQEAIALREDGDAGPILAWLPTPGDQFARCIELNIDLSAASDWMLSEIAAAATSEGRTARVHLKVDTGLGRSGAGINDWAKFVELAVEAQARGAIEVVGIWSHLAYADSPDHPTISRQVSVFEDALAVAKDAGIEPTLRHLANSAATLCSPETHYDLVRPGIAVYGISPGEEVGTPQSLGLIPAMTLSARLVLTKRLSEGHGVSYAHQYVAPRDTNVGLVPMGYADGIYRSASDKAPLLVGGKRRVIAGRVCMDQFVVDLDQDELAAGDEVVLFGSGSRGEPTAQDWAVACDTIAYEIVTCIGPRVPRVYRES